ncbi:MAG: Rad52/Rad22 family DNA repair protein [Candidatus Berkelbacteria bacterium]|nr:Rad52/Rad22 family DNA repair protein [Candidatus Berkelbacteria bacterium]
MSDKKTSTLEEKAKSVNEMLRKGEPVNVTKDNSTGYTGYKPQYIIDAMNNAFGLGNWGFEEIMSGVIKKPDETPELAICQVKIFLKGIEFQPVSWGQSRVTRGDVGDAKKGAQTDAIKKGLAYFSIGNRAYHGLLDVNSKPTPKPKPVPEPEGTPTLQPDGTVKRVYEGEEPHLESQESLVDEVFNELGGTAK